MNFFHFLGFGYRTATQRELLVEICNLKLSQLWRITWFASLFFFFNSPASKPSLAYQFEEEGLLQIGKPKLTP